MSRKTAAFPQFTRLSPAQIAALDFVAFHGFEGQPGGRKTMAILEEKGLIESHDEQDREGALVFVTRIYSMPIHVHMDWCGFRAQGCDTEPGDHA